MVDVPRAGQRLIRCAGSLDPEFPETLGLKCAQPEPPVCHCVTTPFPIASQALVCDTKDTKDPLTSNDSPPYTSTRRKQCLIKEAPERFFQFSFRCGLKRDC
jgi:hypothetical protein